MWGLGVLGWGFRTRGGVRVLERPSHGGSRLTALDAHVFEGGPSVLRWYTASASRFGGATLWRVSRWCEAVDGVVLDRVLGESLRDSFASSVLFWWLLVVGSL